METERSVRYLKGVGEQRAKLLEKLGIHTVGDLLTYYPRAYEDRTHIYPISLAPDNESICIRATVSAPPILNRIRRGMELVKLRAFDDGGSVDITYFNQSYMRDALKQGETYIFYGKINTVGHRRTMSNPDWEPEAKDGERMLRILPKYRLCSGISNKMMINYVHASLQAAGDVFPDVLPADICHEYGLAGSRFAYENIHFPADAASLELARRRLIFEELFTLACALGMLKGSRQTGGGIIISSAPIERFYSSLPFSPTQAQRRVIDQSLTDMSSGKPMNRLIQGDVGSGKTLAAAACIWAVCTCGKQCAFMAPTEILAEQHLETLRGFLSPFGLCVEKLTGSMSAKEKRAVRAGLSNGDIDVIVGTHALINPDVEFADLALVVTDEQHRFGVEQRSALSAKGTKPHVLVMSATPIPRTLALMIYGELDVSVIDQLPPGRQKVDTFAVDESYRERLLAFMEKLISQGRQVFVVCPMVEENEDLDPGLKSASEYAGELSSRFPQFRVGCIHGRMSAREKESIMSSVLHGEIDILVSTTVIEVGVDIPNAALMVVENADRFGLSQLHQLRGRVGRGKHKSYCVLVSDSHSEDARARFKAMCSTNDGFRISEADLQMRGPGDFFGSRQHGLPEMRIASLCGDMQVLTAAQAAAGKLLASDPQLNFPEHVQLRRHIERMFAVRGDTFN